MAASNLVRKYLEDYPGLRVHIFDPKDKDDYDWLKRLAPVHHIRDGPAPDILQEPGVLIWHPKGVNWNEYETWLRRIVEDPNPSLTVFDELKRMQKRPGDPWSYPPSLSVLMREGGGMKHAAITLLQEIADSPREILAQATHVLRFKLENPYDERRADNRFSRARRAGYIRGSEPRNWHGFWHARIDNLDAAREYASWQHFI